MNALARILHDLTHRVPGTPEHTEVAGSLESRQARPARGPHDRRPHIHKRHHHNPPRILTMWQNRIARLVGARHS